MKRILVPVDFYKTSFSAFNYAANLAAEFDEAEITLLHIINGSFNTNDVIIYDPMQARADAALERLAYFHTEYPKELGIDIPDVSVRTEVRFGIPGFAIADYANNENYDMIIMGTRDQHNLFDKMLGSASAITIRTAECPVMLIHENVKYNRPEKIVFAFDEKSELENALESLIDFNTDLKAKVDFIHVSKKGLPKLEDQKEEILDEVFEDQPSFSFEIKTIEGDSIHVALKDYCLFEKADILTMMHRDQGVFQRLFTKQHSVKMAQEFHLPVIVFHEND